MIATMLLLLLLVFAALNLRELLSTNYSNTAANASINATTALLNNGFLKLYTGAQPANANLGTTGTLIITHTFGNPAFGNGVGGVATANAIGSAVAAASGTVGYGRLFESDGTTVVCDCSVGTAGTNLIVTSTNYIMGNTYTVSGLTLTQPLQGA